MLRDKITAIFVKVDDFCNEFEHEFKKSTLLPRSGASIQDWYKWGVLVLV
jgi:hypothetical protein